MRILAIGDIHGCLLQFNELLAAVKPTGEDLVVTLGDYVDRGPDSKGVLDRLIELRKSGMRLVCLRGNHEVLMLNARAGGRGERANWLSVGGLQTLGSYGNTPGKAGTLENVPDEHWEFLDYDLLEYYETDRFIFVHAGVHCDRDMDEQSETMLYWEFLKDSMRHQSRKTVICGHTSQRSGEVKVVPGAACIDTFAYGGGWLTCLDVENEKYLQVNALGKLREGRVNYD